MAICLVDVEMTVCLLTRMAETIGVQIWRTAPTRAAQPYLNSVPLISATQPYEQRNLTPRGGSDMLTSPWLTILCDGNNVLECLCLSACWLLKGVILSAVWGAMRRRTKCANVEQKKKNSGNRAQL